MSKYLFIQHADRAEDMSSKCSHGASSNPTVDRHISYISNGGQDPGNMATPPQPYQSLPEQHASMCNIIQPGQPIPTPFLLQMVHDNSLPVNLIKVGDQWMKPGCTAVDVNQAAESDPHKIAEMENFDRVIQKTTEELETQEQSTPFDSDVNKTAMKQKRDIFFTNYKLQIEAEEVEEINEFTVNMCAQDDVEGQDEDCDETIQVCDPDTVINNKETVECEGVYESPKKTVVNDSESHWPSGKEPSECEEPSTDIAQHDCRENLLQRPSGKEPSECEEPSTDIIQHDCRENLSQRPSGKEPSECEEPCTDIIQHDCSESTSQWPSGKMPSECEEPCIDRVHQDSSEYAIQNSMPSCLPKSSDLPVTDLLENANSICDPLSDTAESWNGRIVNMSEMMGPPPLESEV